MQCSDCILCLLTKRCTYMSARITAVHIVLSAADCCSSSGEWSEVLLGLRDVVDVQHSLQVVRLVLADARIEASQPHLALHIPLVHVANVHTRRTHHTASKPAHIHTHTYKQVGTREVRAGH